MTPERVSVKLKDGRWIEHETSQVPGSAERPMTVDEVLTKFEACGGAPQAAGAFLDGPGDQMLLDCTLFAGAVS